MLCVVAGRLRVEFKDEPGTTITLGQGDVLVLPPNTSCRAYRWPRDAEEAALFLAVTARSPTGDTTKPDDVRVPERVQGA